MYSGKDKTSAVDRKIKSVIILDKKIEGRISILPKQSSNMTNSSKLKKVTSIEKLLTADSSSKPIETTKQRVKVYENKLSITISTNRRPNALLKVIEKPNRVPTQKCKSEMRQSPDITTVDDSGVIANTYSLANGMPITKTRVIDYLPSRPTNIRQEVSPFRKTSMVSLYPRSSVSFRSAARLPLTSEVRILVM